MIVGYELYPTELILSYFHQPGEYTKVNKQLCVTALHGEKRNVSISKYSCPLLSTFSHFFVLRVGIALLPLKVPATNVILTTHGSHRVNHVT